MDEKITIIEGPPPTFELIPAGWVTGIAEGPDPSSVAVTRVRTFNGGELVERCYKAWSNRQTIHLEYRTHDGLEQKVPIVAARYRDTTDGQVLFLWVQVPDDEMEVEFDFYYDEEDDEGDEGEDNTIDLNF